MDWDHLRFFAALAQTGTLAGAARALEVEHTTVARRIQALEQQLGYPLFVREVSGHKLNEAGRQLLSVAQAMEKAARGMEHLTQQVTAETAAVAGLVRVGVTEGLGGQLLAAPLAMLSQQHPKLSVDLLALPRLMHLSRREADIVISLERPKRGTVVVSKLADYHLYLYGERQYLAHKPLVRGSEDLRHHHFIDYVDDLLFTKELQLLAQLHKPLHYVFRSTSIAAQYEAVRAGAGLAVLPAFLADRDPLLQRVLPETAKFERTFWMSMPEEAKGLLRIQTVWRLIKQIVAEHQAALRPI
ncbi:MAG TPA: LysR family transcriptional regulator [Comamonas sp.]|uniref:LysR family transcriptional regulator n=1 Tax=Comamonas halotolerans TaxID=3041496 RepID=UPI0024E0938B|nr:LysR family transcriptional regulator [Comamonas sp. NoAH]